MSREMTNEEAISNLNHIYGIVSPDIQRSLDVAIKALEERPQVEWIPVSERLPEIDKEVIVTDIETTDTYCSWYHGNGYWECDNGVLKNRIIAWQPLPEPYKKGGAEE